MYVYVFVFRGSGLSLDIYFVGYNSVYMQFLPYLGWRVSVLPVPAFHDILCTCNIISHSGGMQEWVIQIPSIPILVSVLFPSLHLKYFRRKFLLLVLCACARNHTHIRL